MSGYAGLKSAALNVDINLSSLKDRLFAESKLRELDVVMQSADKDAEAVYQLVKNRL
jgi:formiminotetrahydrofolate cyclodeaminase